MTLLDKNNTKVTTPATLELHKVASVFALGEVGGSGETAFKFVAKTVADIPSRPPSTGNAPEMSMGPVWAIWLIVALGLVLTAGLSAGVVVRRPTHIGKRAYPVRSGSTNMEPHFFISLAKR